MKRWLNLMFIVLFAVGLAGCGNDASPEREQVEAEEMQEESIDLSEDKGSLTLDAMQEVVEGYALGQSDKLVESSFEEGVVYYKISLGEHDSLTPDLRAESMYSSLSDELLKYTGWDTLQVEFVEVGKVVSFDYDEHETNEVNLKYFPSLKINERIR